MGTGASNQKGSRTKCGETDAKSESKETRKLEGKKPGKTAPPLPPPQRASGITRSGSDRRIEDMEEMEDGDILGISRRPGGPSTGSSVGVEADAPSAEDLSQFKAEIADALKTGKSLHSIELNNSSQNKKVRTNRCNARRGSAPSFSVVPGPNGVFTNKADLKDSTNLGGAGRTARAKIYSSALTDAVEMRMRAKRGETSLPKGPKLSELDLNDPQRTLAAAELYNMITKQFNLPALSLEAKDFGFTRLAKLHAPLGELIIEQGTFGDKIYILTEGSIEFTKDGTSLRTLRAPVLFGELSVIFNTERTAACRIVGDGAATMFGLDKQAWSEFVTMDASAKKTDPQGGARPTLARRSSDFNVNNEVACDIALEELEPVMRLGEGGFSTVTLARCARTNQVFAMKTMDKASVVKNALSRKVVMERKLLKRVSSNAYCLRLYCTYMDANLLYLLTEVAECGDLMEHMINLNVIPYKDAQYYCACLVRAIAHCHASGFVHRDVKPENCLVFADGTLKLGDLGLAKELPYTVDLGDGTKSVCSLAFTMCGTPEFLAPEFIFSQGYDKRVDWWAFGCVMYEMLFAASPFVTNDLKSTFTRICDAASGKLAKSIQDDLARTTRPASKLLLSLICEREQRLPRKEDSVEDIVKHAYYAGFDWDAFERHTMKPPPLPPNKVKGLVSDGTNFFPTDVPTFTGDSAQFDGFV